MASDVAAFGRIDFTKKTLAAWKRLDATPSSVVWGEFGATDEFRGSVADALERLRDPSGAWAWKLEIGATRLALRGVLAGDAFADHARLLALVWLRAGEAGATGTLHLRGFESSDYGVSIEAAPVRGSFHPRVMSAAEKKAADASADMGALQAEVAELAELEPDRATTKKPVASASKKPAKSAGTKGVTRSVSELVEATATGKPKDRVAALAALVDADPVAAEKITLSWLEPKVLDDERLYSLVNAAAETAGKLGTPACIAQIAQVAYDGTPEYASFASKKALAATKSPATATAVLATLTDEAIIESPPTAIKLLEILLGRGEAGDSARLRAIRDDATRLGKGRDLPKEVQEHWAAGLRQVTEKLLALPE